MNSRLGLFTITTLCLYLGACTKSVENVPTTAAASAAQERGAAVASLIQRKDKAESSIPTVAGDVTYIDNKVKLGGRLLFDDEIVSDVYATFDATTHTTILFAIGGMGASCPSTYMFLRINKDGSTSKTGSFGTCSDGPEIGIENNQISVTMPKLNGDGDETWVYANDTLSKKSPTQNESAESITKIHFKEDEPARIRGTLLKDAKSWYLELPKKVMLSGDEDNRCRGLVTQAIQISDQPPGDAANAIGERDFDVRISCPGSVRYVIISDISLPNSLPIAPAKVAPSPPPAPKQSGHAISQGSLICFELRAINKAIALQRAGYPAGLPHECALAPQILPVRVIGASPMPGIFVVQVGAEQAFVRQGDLKVH